MTGRWWHPQWVLFAVFGNGDGLVIDQRPGRRLGVIGDLYHEQGADGALDWPVDEPG